MSASEDDNHVWTTFEKQIMLSLIVRGFHLPNHETTNRMTTDHAIKAGIEEEFCTAFNNALHGENYDLDMERDDIMTELKRVLIAQKHVVGPGGLVERGKSKHITRTLNASWRTNRKGDFDGSKREWAAWRKVKVENERRREEGLPLLPEVAQSEAVIKSATEESQAQQQNSSSTGNGNWEHRQTISGDRNYDGIAKILEWPDKVADAKSAYRGGGAIAPGSIDRYVPSYSSTGANGGPVRRAGESFTVDDFISNSGSTPESSTPVTSPFRRSYIAPVTTYDSENASAPWMDGPGKVVHMRAMEIEVGHTGQVDEHGRPMKKRAITKRGGDRFRDNGGPVGGN